MNSVIIDPDMKINMSLDEIIRLTQGEVNNKLKRNRSKKKKKKANGNLSHSVPLFTSSEGVSIFVSKKSSLLTSDVKQSILKAITNRAFKAELIKKSTKVIPAKYQLIKTDNGVEKVLVPVKNYICKPLRKLDQQKSHCDCKKTLHEIPSLLSVPVTKPVHSPFNALKKKLESSMKMDIDNEDDDDVVMLCCSKKKHELIDVEMNRPRVVLSNEQSETGIVKTLNDRFTRLSGKLQF